MSPTPDDYKCFIFGTSFLLIYLAQRWYGRHLQVTWLKSLARYYSLYALLCRIKVFALVLFLYVVAKDVCFKTKIGIANKIVSSRAFASVPATPAGIQQPTPVNAQLLSWMSDDAEDAWKRKKKSYDAKLQQIQDARAALRTSNEEETALRML